MADTPGTLDLTTDAPEQAEPKRRKRHVVGDSTCWECPTCTFINEDVDSLQCELCAGKRPGKGGGWTCSRCTCVNDIGMSKCSACAAGNPDAASGSAAVVVIEDDLVVPTMPAAPPPHAKGAQATEGTASCSGDDVYILDSCACRHSRAELAAHLAHQLDSMPNDLAALLGHFRCPSPPCARALAARDLQHVLGTDAALQVAAAITAAAQLRHLWAACQSASSTSTNPSITCPLCKPAPLKRVADLSSLTAAELGDALTAHGVSKLPRKQAQRAQQLAELSAACSHICCSCACGLSSQSGAVLHITAAEPQPDAACQPASEQHPQQQQQHAQQQQRPANADAAAQCMELFGHIQELFDALTSEAAGDAGDGRDGGASGSASAGPKGKGKKKHRRRRHHKGYNGGWAKGIGYGGGEEYDDQFTDWRHPKGGTQHQPAAMSAAQRRQAGIDDRMVAALDGIHACLSPQQHRAQKGRAVPGAVPGLPFGDLPLGVWAVVQRGPLALCLRWLLQNDSLMDIGKRVALYRSVLKLLQRLGSCIDFIPLLQAQAAYSGKRIWRVEVRSESGDEGDEEEAPSVLACLRVLNTQCDVFKRSAQQLGEEEDDVAVLSLALDIKDTYEQLSAAATIFQQAMPQPPPATQPHADVDVDLANEAGPSGNGSPASASAVKQLEKRYVDVMRDLRYTAFPLLAGGDFYFRQQAGEITRSSGGGGQMKARLRRLTEEHSCLSTSLPAAWGSSIFLAADEARLDVLRALIIGPSPDSPYANGAFFFDILMLEDYPNDPPQVQFLTTGGGRVAFNPNLYACGKVCLSLLGTWSGPGWVPGQSTLLQVLVSIQSMILVPDPYFNEPGFERSRGSAEGDAASSAFNTRLHCETLKHAILAPLEKPPAAFADVLRHHFSLKRQEIEEQCAQWVAEAPNPPKPPARSYNANMWGGSFGGQPDGSGGPKEMQAVAAKISAALKNLK